MVRYNSPHTRQVAKMMPYVCGIIFACFAFFYLYFYQADYLAQFQYHFSHGETSYNSFVGAVLIILPLLFLGQVLCLCVVSLGLSAYVYHMSSLPGVARLLCRNSMDKSYLPVCPLHHSSMSVPHASRCHRRTVNLLFLLVFQFPCPDYPVLHDGCFGI